MIGKALRDEELYTRMLDVSVGLQAVLGKLESQSGAPRELRGPISDVRSDPRRYLRLKLSLF